MIVEVVVDLSVDLALWRIGTLRILILFYIAMNSCRIPFRLYSEAILGNI